MLNIKYQYNLFPDCSTTMVRASVDVRNQWKASDSYTDYLHSYMDCKRYLHSSTSLAFVDGLQRTCVFKYGSLVFVYGLQLEVVLRKSYSVAQDTILIQQSLLERDEWGIVNAGNC